MIYGAGAIGGTIGAKLFQHGREVMLICRGPHLEAIRRDGLTLRTPDETVTQRVPVAGHPSEIEWRGDEAVIMTMKSQHTQAALETLRDAAGDVPVITCQNGVANERMALRIFPRTYAMVVRMPATHLTPGEVIAHASPLAGVLDIGRYPEGSDALCEQVAADLSASDFGCQADAKVMRLKYAKLLFNLANTVHALCGSVAAGDIVRRVRDEALMAYDAAGIDCATAEELNARGVSIKPVPGAEHAGGSTWQSMMRGGSLETDYLNGEIAHLAALHGRDAPVNRMLQFAAAEAVRDGKKPGDITVDELMARLG